MKAIYINEVKEAIVKYEEEEIELNDLLNVMLRYVAYHTPKVAKDLLVTSVLRVTHDVPEPLCLECFEGWLAFQFNSSTGHIWHEYRDRRRFLYSSISPLRLNYTRP